MKSDYRGPRLISPPPTTKEMSPDEIEHVRALYAGYVSFVDERLGQFLKKVEAMGLMKNTIIVFVADHGTMMGEQGQFHNGAADRGAAAAGRIRVAAGKQTGRWKERGRRGVWEMA